jgi:transposase
MELMPERLSQIALLKMQGKTAKEIAEIRGVSVDRIRQDLGRIKKYEIAGAVPRTPELMQRLETEKALERVHQKLLKLTCNKPKNIKRIRIFPDL